MTNGKPPCDPIVTSGEAVCATPGETRALGARFAAALEPGAILSLEGTLGAGKTQFVKGFAAEGGHSGEVSSPTFTLLHEYAGRLPMVHFDWYRLEDESAVIGLGWDDYLAGGETLLVEWGDRFLDLLPSGAWRLRFEIDGESRVIKWERIP
jgi:tRNA threonylcarbamoyladenosine biosynthesis protein TsaE